MARVYNFGAGPATLPVEVLQEAQADLVDYKGSGMSIMEMSHRGKEYDAVHNEAVANIKELLGLNDDYAVLFLQGGASLQFAMLPMNFLGEGQTADYINAGSWGAAAVKQARLIGNVNIAADCQKDIPTRMPDLSEMKWTPGAAYSHITTNETISGAQFKALPETGSPLVADMSSDILSRTFDVSKFGIIYAGAQKNMGPAGVTVVIIRKDLAENAPPNLPTMLQYSTHIENSSTFNTCPVMAIFVVHEVMKWLKKWAGCRRWKRSTTKRPPSYTISWTTAHSTAAPCRRIRGPG